jgi:membrane fusion protein (multidrug efflux system)
VAVPSSAVNFAPYGNSVYVVVDAKPDAKGKTGKEVAQHVVTLGATRGDQVEIVKGLNPDEEVVTSGVFKLRGGLPIQINNSAQPSNELNPVPSDT